MAKVLEETTINTIERPWGERPRFEPSPRWVRVKLGGTFIADSKRVMLLLEPRKLGSYYFPVEDVRMDLLTRAADRVWTVQVGDRVAERAAWERTEYPGYVAFKWDLMDAWFEEDDEVWVHPRDPYHRVDVVSSSRHVQIVVDGVTVADSHRPHLLFETGLPTRYYLPKLDVKMELLTPTTTHTRCPYKGQAKYWSLTVGGREYKDIVWSYSPPIPECPRIDNLVAFYNEKVEVFVDGERQPTPKTPWS
jgi:uncharacterized protein (DUF427 family)